jgi:Co/Zn/Cd efflux system component
MTDLTLGDMIISVVSIVVGVALIPIIYTQVTAANITDPTVAAMVALIPFFFALSIVVSVVKPMF